MRKLTVLLFVLILAAAAFPAVIFAQSKDFPNTSDCAANYATGSTSPNNKMGFKAKFSGVPAGFQNVLPTAEVTSGSCASGAVVAKNSANAFCTAAVGANYKCKNNAPVDPVACVDGGCCARLETAPGQIICTTVLNGADGFLIARAANSTKFEFFPAGTYGLVSVLHNTNAGNAVGNDPLPVLLAEINPAAGNLTVRVTHACGGTNPKTFVVNQTGKTTLQIAQEVANGFNTLLLGCTNLPATVHALGEIGQYSSMPGEFHCSYFVRVTNVSSVSDVDIAGVPGQLIVTESTTGTAASISVPALSPWPTAVLILTLLLSSLWFLRRRLRSVQS
jgi:hypothetical protein